MASIGSQYSFGRRKPVTGFQRFEAWRQFRRTQSLWVIQGTQAFSTAFLQNYQRKIEDASIGAAQAALNRIVDGHNTKTPASLQQQLTRILDKKV